MQPADAMPGRRAAAVRSTQVGAANGSYVDLRAMGARGDGVSDDTKALRLAILAAVGDESPLRTGGTIVLPRGTYRITNMVGLYAIEGLRLVGEGVGATRILWDGRTEDPALFHLRDTRTTSFENLSIVNVSPEPLECAFWIESTGEAPDAESNIFRSVRVDGREAGVRCGFRFTCNVDEDVSNSWHRLDDVVVREYVDAAFSLEHLTVSGIEFYTCRFEGLGRGRSGVATNRGSFAGSQNYGGSFRWFGGGGGGNRGADFELGDVADTILIQGGQFRGSARFFHSAGPSGNQWPIVIESVVWLDDMLGEMENAIWPAAEQMRVMNFQFRGPLVVSGCNFGVPPDPVHGPQIAKPAEIIWNPGNNFGQFVFQGNYFATSKTNPFTGFTAVGSTIGIYPTIQVGNIVETEDFGSNSTVEPMPVHITGLSGGPQPTVGWLHTNRRLFTTGGGASIENLLHGRVGQEIVIFASGEREIRHTDSIRLQGGTSFSMKAGDNLTLIMVTEGVWTEVARTVF